MKRPSLKPTLALLTFFTGLGLVSLWSFSQIGSTNEQSLSEAGSLVEPVKSVYESPCDYPQPQLRELEAEEAVYRAECFIIRNGYTDLLPVADKSRLTPENVFSLTDDAGMEMRHDSLERKAYSYERSEIYGGSWLIMFRLKPLPEIVEHLGKEGFDEWGGRAVVMNYYGQKIKIQHSNYPLNMPGAKRINR